MGRVRKSAAVTREVPGAPIEDDDPFGFDKSGPRPAVDPAWSDLKVVTNDFGEVLYCSYQGCRGEQRLSPGGAVCARGHGGAEGYPMGSKEIPVVPDHVHMEIGGKPAYPECPDCVAEAKGRQASAEHKASVKREAEAAVDEKSTLPKVPAEKPRTPLDDFLDETTRAVPEPRLDPSVERIINLVYEVDVEAEFRRLTGKLREGVTPLNRAARREQLDMVEHDTVVAARLHQVAAAHLVRWRIDLREREAVFRAEAVRQLSLEKGTAERKKQITISDVEDYCVGNYGDEWRSNSARTARLEGAVAVLAELLAAYRSRQATLRDLCRGDGG